MARKEINIFSVSFLDLLSGALAAVIILFIIVPKMSQNQQEAQQTLEEMDVQASELQEIIEQSRNAIPEEIYEQLQEQVSQMQEQIDDLQQQVSDLNSELADCQRRREELESQLEEAQQQQEQTQEQLQECEEELDRTREQQEEQQQQSRGGGGAGGALMGVDPEFAVICEWEENIDVDLYLRNTSTDEWINYDREIKKFGRYFEDVQEQDQESDENRFEMIFQEEEVVPGTYEVWYHVYEDTTSTIDIAGYAVLFPYTSRESKKEFQEISLGHTDNKPFSGGGMKVATIKLSENRMEVMN